MSPAEPETTRYVHPLTHWISKAIYFAIAAWFIKTGADTGAAVAMGLLEAVSGW